MITTAAPGLRLAVIAALFSFSAGPVGVVVQKWLVASISPFFIVAVQMSVGAIMLWTLRAAAFPKTDVPHSAILKGLGLGILHPGGFMIVYAAASGRLDSVTAVLLLALVPAFVAIGGRVVLKEALRPVILIGIVISLAGLVVLVSERDVTGANQPFGFFLGIVGLILASGSVITGRALNKGAVLPWFVLAPLQVTGAAIAAWVGVLVTGAAASLTAIADNFWAFAYLGFGMTAASYFAYNFALSRLPAPTLGLLSAAGPGVGALAAAIIFSTAIGPVAGSGIAIILAGAALPSAWGLWTARRLVARLEPAPDAPDTPTPPVANIQPNPRSTS